MTEQCAIDYRDLLKRYMWMVGEEEGITFVSRLEYHLKTFTDREMDELRLVESEIHSMDRPSAHSDR